MGSLQSAIEFVPAMGFALIRSLATIASIHTLVAVARRISTLCGADRIIVLEDGPIIAEYTYNELLATSPTFRTFRTLAGVDG